MTKKYYVLLYKSEPKSITFPIKAVTNLIDKKPQWAGGYPAIFGGTDEKRVGARDTLVKELGEESRGTLVLTKTEEQWFTLVYKGTVDQDEMYFYVTEQWQRTKKHWDPNPKDRGEGEMLKVVENLPLKFFTKSGNFKTTMETLIEKSEVPGGDEWASFICSETAKAFWAFIKKYG